MALLPGGLLRRSIKNVCKISLFLTLLLLAHHKRIFVFEMFLNVVFTIEYLGRFYAAQMKLQFVLSTHILWSVSAASRRERRRLINLLSLSNLLCRFHEHHRPGFHHTFLP